jgi:hypothetical protein
MVNALKLAALRDVHLPSPQSWWPLAPAWYILVILVLMSVITGIILIRRHHQHGRFKRQALRLLASYQQQPINNQISCANISELLKRVALVYYPRQQVAGLQGEAWLNFLNNSAKGVNFNSVKILLLERPFQHPQASRHPERVFLREGPPITDEPLPDDLAPLFKCALLWIKKQGKPCLN